METIATIYFSYMFVSVYFLFLVLVLYFHNRKRLFYFPELNENYSLSVLVPAYNEEKTIRDTIEHIFMSDYKGLKEVIVINDGSKDNTLKIARSLVKKYPKLIVLDKTNSGKANSLNYALKFVKGDYVAIIDADSYPNKNAFSRMMGYFSDTKVGAVTAACTPRNRTTFLERLQTIEYKVIAFSRKLLEYIESIYVAPGSTSIYRKKALMEIGGFDPKNMTEDIESTWHILKNGWKVRMSLSATVTTEVPNKIKAWWIQRVRWTIGGMQVLKKYFKYVFRRGMFGYFVVPFFLFGMILGIVGIGIFGYVYAKKVINTIIIASYKLSSDVYLATLSDFNIAPSLLNYFGIVLFVLFLVFNIFVLWLMKDNIAKKSRWFDMIVYMTIYLILYPFMIIWSVYKWVKGEFRWR